MIIKDFRVSKRELRFLDWLAKSGLFSGFPDFFRYFRRFSRISGLFSGISGLFPGFQDFFQDFRSFSVISLKRCRKPENFQKYRKSPEILEKVRKSGKTSGNTGKSPEILEKVQIWLTSPESRVLSWKPGNL